MEEVVHLFGQHESYSASVYALFKMASSKSAKQKSPKNSLVYPGKMWTLSEPLLEVMKDETILFSLDKAETLKEKRAADKNVQSKVSKQR